MQQELAEFPGDGPGVDTSRLPLHVALRVEIATAGVRQFEIASKIGVSEGQLSRMLAGRKVISPEQAGQIRDAIKELAA